MNRYLFSSYRFESISTRNGTGLYHIKVSPGSLKCNGGWPIDRVNKFPLCKRIFSCSLALLLIDFNTLISIMITL